MVQARMPCKWTGSSQSYPELNCEYSHKTCRSLLKAVRWAIGFSLQTSKPCLTTFLLPFDAKVRSACQQWLGHPAVCKINIACTPKRTMSLQMPDAWQTRVTFSRLAQEDTLIFTVDNNQGFGTFVDLALSEQGLHGLPQFTQFMQKSLHDICTHSDITQQPIASLSTASLCPAWWHGKYSRFRGWAKRSQKCVLAQQLLDLKSTQMASRPNDLQGLQHTRHQGNQGTGELQEWHKGL